MVFESANLGHTPSKQAERWTPRRAACLLWVLAVGGCAGAEKPTASPDGEEPGVAPPLVEETPKAEAAPESDGGAAELEEAEAPAEDPNAIRDVVYKMAKGGLEIEVDGVVFRPQAKPHKLKGGAWGVTITMEAEGVGDSARHLLKPEAGVLAFAGSVKRKGNPEKFGDQRKGDESVELTPGATLSFESSWPKSGKAAHGLWWGNELSLDVGLWGLGASKETLRPVKQFFTLRMVAGNKPQPVIQPPKSAE